METVMDRFLAAALAAALTTSSGVALAQSQPGAPTSDAPAKPATAKAPRVHHARAAHGDPDTKALNLLEANGYTDIRQFRRIGQHYEAVITKDGKPVTVVVDPATGDIRNRA
jgi:hypothetical protein